MGAVGQSRFRKVFVGGEEAPISIEQEGAEVGTKVEDRGGVDGVKAIEVEVGEVGSMLCAKFVHGR